MEMVSHSSVASPEAAIGRSAAALMHLLGVVLSVAIAGGAFWLFRVNNDFPTNFYHPDEPGKLAQLAEAAPWNFNHPVLLMQSASTARKLLEVPIDARELTILGRSTSAALAALGVLAAALAGYVTYRFIGLFLSGLMVALCPALLINAHFFKEDASLIGGMMLAILGAAMVTRSARSSTVILSAVILGIGCAAAASGKLVGIITAIPALFALASIRLGAPNPKNPPASPTPPPPADLAGGAAAVSEAPKALPAPFPPFADQLGGRDAAVRSVATAACIVSWALALVFINYRAFVQLPTALSAFTGEIGHALEGHYGLGLSVPNAYALRVAAGETLPVVWVLLGLGAVWALLVRRRITRWGIVLAMFLGAFAAVMTINRIPIPRYALPLTVGIYFLAAQLISAALTDLKRPRRLAPVLGMACVAAVLFVQGRRCAYFTDQFRDDGRQRMYVWMAQNVPPGSRVLMDAYTSLHGGGDPWRFPDQPHVRQNVTYTFSVADMGDLQGVINQGFDYIAVANMNFDRFLDPHVGGVRGNEQWFEQHRRFYEDLFARGELVWSAKPPYQSGSYVGQDLRLYRVAQLASPGSRQPQRPVTNFLRDLFN